MDTKQQEIPQQVVNEEGNKNSIQTKSSGVPVSGGILIIIGVIIIASVGGGIIFSQQGKHTANTQTQTQTQTQEPQSTQKDHEPNLQTFVLEPKQLTGDNIENEINMKDINIDSLLNSADQDLSEIDKILPSDDDAY